MKAAEITEAGKEALRRWGGGCVCCVCVGGGVGGCVLDGAARKRTRGA